MTPTRLELAAVSKAFGARRVLNQVWLQLRAGETVGLVGANGAGKTTLLRIAAGLVRPDAGTVRWESARPSLRYFAGEVALPPDVSARRWAAFFGAEATDTRRIGALSRGTRQLLGLRAALAAPGAAVLLLDEPWDGLDPAAALWLTQAIREWAAAGRAVLISSHRLHDLDDVAGRFVLLENGRCQPILEGSGDDRARRIASLVARPPDEAAPSRRGAAR
jgi:ABC-2 type transport system ATP-binding protein